MFNQDRRKCFFYGQSSFLRAYQRANQRIWKNYRQSTHNICQEGMRYLQQITEKYLQQRKQDIETSQYTAQFNQNSSADLFSFRMPIEKKPLIQHDQSTQNESKNIVVYTEKKQKTKEWESFESRDSDNEEQDADYLKKSLKKLGINQEDIEDDNFDYENQKENWQITNGFKDKTIQQIIIESNNKLLEVISNKKSVKIQNENNYLSDSQDYPITQYSSNQSSNDNDYEQNFRYTTGQHFKNELSSQESFHSLKDQKSIFPNTKVYATSNITLSPKKSKSKSKRTYLGSKMIPRWAQDLKKVSEQVVKQRKNENFNPQEIYGICIIEKLNTGLILKKQINYQRGSSAKWKKYPQSHFIC